MQFVSPGTIVCEINLAIVFFNSNTHQPSTLPLQYEIALRSDLKMDKRRDTQI